MLAILTIKRPKFAVNHQLMTYFQHLFIMLLSLSDQEFLAVAQTASQPRPISAKTLDTLSVHIFKDISKRKKKRLWGFRHIWVTSWKEFSIPLGKWHFETSWTHQESRYFRMSMLLLTRPQLKGSLCISLLISHPFIISLTFKMIFRLMMFFSNDLTVSLDDLIDNR